MTRGEMQAFVSSIHAIVAELDKIEDKVSSKVYDELYAMENVLKRELADDGQANKFSRL